MNVPNISHTKEGEELGMSDEVKKRKKNKEFLEKLKKYTRRLEGIILGNKAYWRSDVS